MCEIFIVKNNLLDNSTCIKVISDLNGIAIDGQRLTGGVEC